MPMGMALAAAALRLYPYGGQARIMQYIAPAICLMAGLGLSTLLEFVPRPTGRAAAIRVAAITLAVVGIITLMDDFRHPYRAIYDHQAREFARRFWPELARGAEVACLQWDFGIRSAECRHRPHGDLPVQSAYLFAEQEAGRRATLDTRDAGTAAPLRGLWRRSPQESRGDRLARIDERDTTTSVVGRT